MQIWRAELTERDKDLGDSQGSLSTQNDGEREERTEEKEEDYYYGNCDTGDSSRSSGGTIEEEINDAKEKLQSDCIRHSIHPKNEDINVKSRIEKKTETRYVAWLVVRLEK